MLEWTTHAGMELVHICGLVCTTMGAVGLAVAVFQLAFFVAHTEATLTRAAVQLLLIPADGYMLNTALPANSTWSATSFSLMLLCMALIGTGSIGLTVGSVEMTMYHIPPELWRRMAFYTTVLGTGLVLAPFEFRIKFM